MAKRSADRASERSRDGPVGLLHAGLDALNFGFAVFDKDLKLVTSNKTFRTLRGYPAALCRPGTEIIELYRFNADRGDYGPGDVETHAKSRLDRVRKRQRHELEYELASGRILNIQYAPIARGGLLMSYADTTERKRAEEELAQHEAVLEATMESVAQGIAMFDDEFNAITLNRKYLELLEFPPEWFECGFSLEQAFRFNAARGEYGTGDAEEHVRKRLESVRKFEPHHYERTRPDGTVLEVRGNPVSSGGFVTTYTDVTERKRAEDALRESEERYALAMAGANEGMWDWSAGTDEIVVSASYKRLVGLDMIGDTMSLDDWVALIHPDDLAARVQAQRVHKEGKAELYECEYRVRCGDGEYRWFLDRARSIRDEHGDIFRMAGSMTDVTARKQAEQGLLEANRRINEQNQMLESLSSKLSKYLSPQLYTSIFSGEQSVEIASKRKKLTVLFSDIADFTETTESLESEELTSLLNHYLTEMSKIALKYGATIDKYVGDAMMLFFGDPKSRGAKEDAIACVELAVAMQRRMSKLQAEWRDRGLEQPFQLRIGINTGYCTVGNFGSEDRMDYTIIGNEVNLAARLQSHAEVGGILMANETYSLVKDTVLAEEQDTISVKGFAKPVRTYKVVGICEDLIEQGRVIRKEQDGLRILLDLNKQDKATAINAIEDFLSELKD